MLSVPHLIVIFVVALVVFGPEKLPDLARNIGKVMAEFRRATGDLKSTFEDHLREIERETNQRRIDGAPAAAVSAPEYAPVEQESLTVPTTPPHLAAGAEPTNAPWEAAADTAADAMNISTDAPGPSVEPQQPAENHESADNPHQETEENTEPAIHDDRPA